MVGASGKAEHARPAAAAAAESPDEPVDHRRRLGFLLARVGRRAWTLFEDALEPLGLRPRHLVVLMELRQRGGAGTQRSLVEALQFDPGTLVDLLNDLEVQGLVIRRRDPADRRRHIVETTGQGAERLDQADRAVTAAETRLLGALDPDQRHHLTGALQRIAGAE